MNRLIKLRNWRCYTPKNRKVMVKIFFANCRPIKMCWIQRLFNMVINSQMIVRLTLIRPWSNWMRPRIAYLDWLLSLSSHSYLWFQDSMELQLIIMEILITQVNLRLLRAKAHINNVKKATSHHNQDQRNLIMKP